MDKASLELLEWKQVRHELAGYTFSEEGHALLLKQGHTADPAEWERRHKLAGDFLLKLQSTNNLPDLAFPPARELLPVLEKEGAVLEGVQLAGAASYMESAFKLRQFLLKKGDNPDALSGFLAREAEAVPDMKQAARRIFGELQSDGSIKENHPALKPIRRRLRQLDRDLEALTASYLSEKRDIWQADVPTQREGRTVLPLKSNYRGKVNGIVHEVSSRGATLFIEPYDVVEKNNQLAMERERFRQECFRILKALTVFFRQYAGEFRRLTEQVAFLDTYYARARYAAIHDCSPAERREAGVALYSARHPMLGGSAVPIDLVIEDEKPILIITGPNAGGKTVSLKTCGLFALMNQFGLAVPAAPGSGMPLYSDILADIGDDQSIEQSLSTYSGHIRRISSMLEKCDSRSLVLLDELGAGTDPREGSSLAMALLEEFSRRGAQAVVTTHHSAIKNFAYTNDKARNASVAFDSVAMKPTYRIIAGVPGESHALEIASSHGMPAPLIERARELMQGSGSTVAEMIQQLEDRHREAEETRRELKKRQASLNEKQRRIDLKELSLRQKELEVRQGEYGRMKNFIQEARSRLENLVAELKSGAVSPESTRRVKDFISEISREAETEQREMETESRQLFHAAHQQRVPDGERLDQRPLPGMKVKIRNTDQSGEILRAGKAGKWVVLVGSMKMTVKEADIIPVEGPVKTSPAVKISGSYETPAAEFQLDLRGMTLEEALGALERQLDRALLSRLQSFNVIHGMGEGILQKGVRDYLRSSPAVDAYDFAPADQGGFGKTIVTLKGN